MELESFEVDLKSNEFQSSTQNARLPEQSNANWLLMISTEMLISCTVYIGKHGFIFRLNFPQHVQEQSAHYAILIDYVFLTKLKARLVMFSLSDLNEIHKRRRHLTVEDENFNDDLNLKFYQVF